MELENRENLFVYGTLKDKKIQKQICGRSINMAPDILPGYKISEIIIDNEVFPLIIQDNDGEVTGGVMQVAKSELERIDEYETVAYVRIAVKLRSGISAWVYVKA